MIQMFHSFLLSEVKSYSTFPNSNFKINECKTFRYNPNRFKGGLILYSNEQLSWKLTLLETFILEFYQNHKKWLF